MKYNFKKIVSWILLLVWMYIIFSFSNQTGGDSGGLSGKIVQVIINIFNIDTTENIYNTLQFAVRKLAHATEYFILGILVFNALYNTINSIKKIPLISITICIIYSITDELHQFFIPDRVASIKDCIIDSTGSLFGIIFCILLVSLITRIKNKNNLLK